MLTCKHCGTSNPLGRVFCGACGKRLDLSNITSQTVLSSSGSNPLARHWGKLVALFIVVLLGVGSLAFFPRIEPIGTKGSSGDASRIAGPLRQLKTLRPGRTLGAEFSEKGINAYLDRMVRRLGVESLSVLVGDSHFGVRLVKALEPISMGSLKFTPRFSFDYVFVPVGPVVRARRASMGRLMLIGPLKHIAVRTLGLLLADQDDWAAFEHVSEIKAEDGKIRIKAVRE